MEECIIFDTEKMKEMKKSHKIILKNGVNVFARD